MLRLRKRPRELGHLTRRADHHRARVSQVAAVYPPDRRQSLFRIVLESLVQISSSSRVVNTANQQSKWRAHQQRLVELANVARTVQSPRVSVAPRDRFGLQLAKLGIAEQLPSDVHIFH